MQRSINLTFWTWAAALLLQTPRTSRGNGAAPAPRFINKWAAMIKRRSAWLCRPRRVATVERPGWIPPEITQGWDSDPYAYQTEEELMPAGGLHGQLLAYIMELLRHLLEERQLMLLLDVFLLYRDESHTKQRIGPD